MAKELCGPDRFEEELLKSACHELTNLQTFGNINIHENNEEQNILMTDTDADADKEQPNFKNLRSMSPTSDFGAEDDQSLMSTYTAAFFNLGVSLEHLDYFELSLMAYKKGRKVCLNYLSSNQGLIVTL